MSCDTAMTDIRRAAGLITNLDGWLSTQAILSSGQSQTITPSRWCRSGDSPKTRECYKNLNRCGLYRYWESWGWDCDTTQCTANDLILYRYSPIVYFFRSFNFPLSIPSLNTRSSSRSPNGRSSQLPCSSSNSVFHPGHSKPGDTEKTPLYDEYSPVSQLPNLLELHYSAEQTTPSRLKCRFAAGISELRWDISSRFLQDAHVLGKHIRRGKRRHSIRSSDWTSQMLFINHKSCGHDMHRARTYPKGVEWWILLIETANNFNDTHGRFQALLNVPLHSLPVGWNLRKSIK